MDPQTHFLFPFFIALILNKLNLISWKLALLCGLIGVLVDLDHYVEHILHSKTKPFSLVHTWNNSVKLHRFNQRSFIHEGWGDLLLTLLFTIIFFFNQKIALVLAIGYFSHLFLDYLHLKKERFLVWRAGPLYLKESYPDLFLDLVLVMGIVVVLLLV